MLNLSFATMATRNGNRLAGDKATED